MKISCKLSQDNVVFVIVDVQGKLAHLMANKEILFENLSKLIKGIQALQIPILWVEQHPKGLGPTIPEIASLLEDLNPIIKSTFSCLKNELFLKSLKEADRSQVLVAGIEAHVCVYQTALDLKQHGYDVHVVSDAVSSRVKENKSLALLNLRTAAIKLTSVEMALFELLETAEHPQFKKISEIVK